jgi:hypothetical protein
MSAIFSVEVEAILTRAMGIALAASHEYVGSEHFFAAICEIGIPELVRFLNEREISAVSVIERIPKEGSGRSFSADSFPLTPRAKETLCRAIQLTRTLPVTSQSLLYALLEPVCEGQTGGVAPLLTRLQIPNTDVLEILTKIGPPPCWPPEHPPVV